MGLLLLSEQSLLSYQQLRGTSSAFETASTATMAQQALSTRVHKWLSIWHETKILCFLSPMGQRQRKLVPDRKNETFFQTTKMPIHVYCSSAVRKWDPLKGSPVAISIQCIFWSMTFFLVDPTLLFKVP